MDILINGKINKDFIICFMNDTVSGIRRRKRVLQSKIGELGMKVFTEPLDSPQGKKTRVRAGPFPTREAAEKALDKLKRIGVNGVIAAKP